MTVRILIYTNRTEHSCAHAKAHGRKELAALLLDYEACAADQVPLLLHLGEDMRALDRAVESGDTDLVYLTIFHMYKKMVGSDKFDEFLGAINAKPQARSLFLKYCKAQVCRLVSRIQIHSCPDIMLSDGHGRGAGTRSCGASLSHDR